MAFPDDIVARLESQFSDRERACSILEGLGPLRERDRVARCILALSESDYDSLAAWVTKANIDYRDLIWYAEYDNREVRKYDFARRFDEQIPYSYPP